MEERFFTQVLLGPRHFSDIFIFMGSITILYIVL
jgi:hypothetical protein